MAYEDFTTYTESDPNARLTVTANKIEYAALKRTDDGAVWKDKGAAHFGNFEHLFEVKIDSETGADYSQVQIWGMSNNSAYISNQDFVDNSDGLICAVADKFSGNLTRWRVVDQHAGNSDYVDLAITTARTYCKIKRDGLVLTLYMYSDSARTTLVGSENVVCDATTYRYIYGILGMESATNDRSLTGEINNLNLQEVGGETHTPSDTAKASDAVIFDVEIPLADDANASDSLIPAVEIPLADDANASDSLIPAVEIPLVDTAKASDSLSFYPFFAHIIGDIAKAADSLITAVIHPFADNPKASDSRVEAVTIPIEDNPKASDSFAYKIRHFATDIAKASDSLSYKIRHFATDTAKALDSLITAVTHPFADTAKAGDMAAFDYTTPGILCPCSTFTLYGTSTNILFPKPEWGSPNNGITKNVDLFNFWVGDLDTVDRGINSRPLTIGGTVMLFETTLGTWDDAPAMTVWLDSIKNAMNDGETFEISELGECLNGVYVIKDFTFDTIPGIPNEFAWSLNLERVKDV